MKSTSIKLHDDISGDCVILDFEKLIDVAKIAMAKSRDAVNRLMGDVQNGIMEGYQTGNYLHAEFPIEGLEREVNNLKVAARVLHTLTSLKKPGNRRETFYLYNLDQQAETLVYDDEL